MQVDNNINTMNVLEENLDKSANNIAQVSSVNSEDTNTKVNDIDLVEEIVEQISIPIAYTANAEVISTHSSVSKTLLDIKA